MSAVTLMDDLTQQVLGTFDSIESAMESTEWAQAAHPTIVVVKAQAQPVMQAAPAWAADAEIARQYAWVAAARAKQAGLRDAFKACLAQARELETVHSPHGKMIAAVVGGCPVRGYEALAQRGRKLGVTSDLAEQAKTLVLS